MKRLASITLSLFLSAGATLADSPKNAPGDSAAASSTAQPAMPVVAESSAEIAAEVDELRQTLQSQQKILQLQQEELQLLKQELAKRDKQIEATRETADPVNARASEANMKATESAATSAEVKFATPALNSALSSNAAIVNAPLAANPQAQPANEEKGPTTIRFKGVSLTPGGFVGADTVNRQHAESADVGTPFSYIPYGASSTGHLSEMNLSARQSRLCLLFAAKVSSTALSGYYEADFLGAGTTSNNRQTNSYVFRQRQLWGQAALANGLSFSGGQMWSLATEDRKSIALRQESLPVMIDPNYVVGFTWQRASAFRVTKAFNEKIAIAVAAEGPQTTIEGRGFSSYTNTSATGVVTTYQNFFFNAPGLGGGFFNAFDPTGHTINKLPDFVAKAAVHPGFGHYELFGIFSDFRNRIYPCAVAGTTATNFPTPTDPTVVSCNGSSTPSAALAYNNSSFGGGLGASATESLLAKRLDVGLKVVGGDGTGRFGAAQLPDLIARPDGTLALIKNLQVLAKVEAHPTPKWDVYGYFGGEYDARAAYTGYTSVKIVNTPAIPGCGGTGQQPCSTPGTIQPSYPALTTTTISTDGIGGYGSPYANNSGCSVETAPAGTGTPGTGGTCAGDTKHVFEATLGFWNKIYQGERAGSSGVCNTPISRATAGPAVMASTPIPASPLMPSTICSGLLSATTCLSSGAERRPRTLRPTASANPCRRLRR